MFLLVLAHPGCPRQIPQSRKNGCVCVCQYYSKTGCDGMGSVHVLRKEVNDWVMKCMEYEAEGSRPRGRSQRTWRDVQKDC